MNNIKLTAKTTKIVSTLFFAILINISMQGQSFAATNQNLILFYAALKGVQVAALSGTADLWRALGSAANADLCLKLASDLNKGDIANEDGMTKFKVASAQLKDTIDDLKNRGIPMTEDQKNAASKANLKIIATGALWAVAGATGIKIVNAKDLKTLEKITLVAVMAGEIGAASSATGDLINAYKSYSSFKNSIDEPETLSKEMSAKFSML